MTDSKKASDGELDRLYNPSISDLMLDEHHDKDRPVVYLDEVKAEIARLIQQEKQIRILKNKSLCGCPMCEHHTSAYDPKLHHLHQEESQE